MFYTIVCPHISAECYPVVQTICNLNDCCWYWPAVGPGSSFDTLWILSIQDPYFIETPTRSRALGTHLTVTHISLDHRGQTLCTHYWPLRDCNGHWSVCRVGGKLWGWTLQGNTHVLPCKVLSIYWGQFQWEHWSCLRYDWRMTLKWLLVFWGGRWD